MSDREKRRFDRQLRAISRASPFLGRLIEAARGRLAMTLRLPLAALLVIGGLLSFLPVLGLWMLPLGLLLLAIDLPAIRPAISACIIRLRRRLRARRPKRSGGHDRTTGAMR